jgi:hypothetical protein
MDEPFDDRRNWIRGLLIECAMGNHVAGCPVAGMRHLPVKDRMALVDGLSDAEIDDILGQHRRCLKRRESTGQ